MIIPQELSFPQFRFVKLRGKIPFEKEWQKHKNYSFDDSELKKHNGNLGLLCGVGGVFVIDIDGNAEDTLKLIFETLPKSYAVKTGKQGYHIYYKSDNPITTTTFDFNKSHIDLKATGGQVVIEGSIHPETKKKYQKHIAQEIKVISQTQLNDLFKLTSPTPQPSLNDVDLTRSGIEWREVCNLISKGKSKVEIFKHMESFSKWKEAHPTYREKTYTKALLENFSQNEDLETTNYLERFGFEIYRCKDYPEKKEFVLLNQEKKVFNLFSHSRIVAILKKELISRGVNLFHFGCNELGLQDVEAKKGKTKQETIENIVINQFMDSYSLVDSIGFKPINEKTFIENGKEHLNLFFGLNIGQKFIDKEKYSFPHISELIKNLVGYKEEYYNWVNKWLAWIIQNPTEKLSTAVILMGEQGSGKGTFREVLKRIFGMYLKSINQSSLNSEFNDYILGALIIFAEEVIHHENKITIPNLLKNYVSDKEIAIYEKYMPTRNAKNYAHWIFTTNNTFPLKIDKDCRRYSVFKSFKPKDDNFFKNVYANMENEVIEYFSYLKTMPVTFEEVDNPCNTEAKKEVQTLSMNSAETFIDYVKEIKWDNLGAQIYYKDNAYILSSELYEVYKVFCEGEGIKGIFAHGRFTAEMKKNGFENKPVKIEGKSQRAFIPIIDVIEKTQTSLEKINAEEVDLT